MPALGANSETTRLFDPFEDPELMESLMRLFHKRDGVLLTVEFLVTIYNVKSARSSPGLNFETKRKSYMIPCAGFDN